MDADRDRPRAAQHEDQAIPADPISPSLREVLVRRQKAQLKALSESTQPDAERLADLYVFGNALGGRIKTDIPT